MNNTRLTASVGSKEELRKTLSHMPEQFLDFIEAAFDETMESYPFEDVSPMSTLQHISAASSGILKQAAAVVIASESDNNSTKSEEARKRIDKWTHIARPLVSEVSKTQDRSHFDTLGVFLAALKIMSETAALSLVQREARAKAEENKNNAADDIMAGM